MFVFVKCVASNLQTMGNIKIFPGQKIGVKVPTQMFVR